MSTFNTTSITDSLKAKIKPSTAAEVASSLTLGKSTNTSATGFVSFSAKDQEAATASKSKYIIDPSPKYDNVHELDATQNDPAKRKTINFKQDYVVVIRKKPFYAATAQQRKDAAGNPLVINGKVQTPDENYIRVYQVNNFTNVRVSSNVYGRRPGSCSVTIRGGERVVCADKESQEDTGWQSWDEMLQGWLQIDETATEGGSTEQQSGGVAGIKKALEKGEYISGTSERIQAFKQQGMSINDAITATNSTANKKWSISESNWAINKQQTIGQQAAKLDYKNLLKTREAKYGWRFAEKADWEPMDEIYIFGKSRSARDDDPTPSHTDRDPNTKILNAYIKKSSKASFKMLPIFFGYIDSVTKTYTANKGGLMITVQASDHLKLLNLSKVINSPTLVPGINSGGGVDVNFNTDAFALYNLNDPLKGKTSMTNDELKQSEDLRKYMFQNIFSGMYPYKIIKLLGLQAGIPEKYLTKRIEEITRIPFVAKIRNRGNGDFFNAELKNRLQVCNDAAEKLFLEFFADETGNIVLKIPNYALGANRIPANNMGIDYPTTLLDDVYGTFKTLDQPNTGNEANNDNSVNSTEDNGTNDTGNSDTENNDTENNDTALDAVAQAQAAVDDAKVEMDDAKDANEAAYQDELEQRNAETDISNQITEAKQRVIDARDSGDTQAEATELSVVRDLEASFDKQHAVMVASQNAASTAADHWYDAEDKYLKAEANLQNVKNISASSADEIPIIKQVIIDEPGQGKNATLYDIAQNYLGDGSRWPEIAALNNIVDPVAITPGQEIIVNANSLNVISTIKNSTSGTKPKISGLTDKINSGLKSLQRKATDLISKPSTNKIVTASNTSTTGIKNVTGKTISETTDMDIPAITPEYIVSFSLVDSDKEIYNMFEIQGETFLGVGEQGKGPLTLIKRAIPDMSSIIRFGLRPHPGLVNTPLVSNPLEAILMGIMMCGRSMANRYSGSITVIEDSAIKVGNPIRVHLYDEHPYKEIKLDRSDNPNAQLKFDKINFPEQAVFYITGIERQIEPSNLSYMTLHVTAGRMMGQESIYDIFMPLYRFYFDEKLMFDFTESLTVFQKTYDSAKSAEAGHWEVYTIVAGDTFQKIMTSKYNIQFDQDKRRELFYAICALNPGVFEGALFSALMMNEVISTLETGTEIKIPSTVIGMFANVTTTNSNSEQQTDITGKDDISSSATGVPTKATTVKEQAAVVNGDKTAVSDARLTVQQAVANETAARKTMVDLTLKVNQEKESLKSDPKTAINGTSSELQIKYQADSQALIRATADYNAAIAARQKAQSARDLAISSLNENGAKVTV